MSERKIPLNIAHRGASGYYPENTLLAFEEAIKANADIIELDLQLTADDNIVVFHDRNVDRIFKTQAGQTIRSFTLEQLKERDVGAWFKPQFTGIKIPTLEDVIDNLPEQTSLILELKSTEEKLAQSVINILEERNKSLGLGYLSVRDIQTLNRVRDISSNYMIGLMQKNKTPEEMLALIDSEGLDIVQIRWRNWTEENWNKLQEKEVVVTVFFADEMKDYSFLVSKQVDGILTNYPFKLARFIENLKL